MPYTLPVNVKRDLDALTVIIVAESIAFGR